MCVWTLELLMISSLIAFKANQCFFSCKIGCLVIDLEKDLEKHKSKAAVLRNQIF